MKIKIIAKIGHPESEDRSGGKGSPIFLEGEVLVDLTPDMLVSMLKWHRFKIENLCKFDFQYDRNTEVHTGIFCQSKNEPVTIQPYTGSLLGDSKKKVSENIRALIKMGWKFVLTREQWEKSGYDYPITDLFQ